MTRPMDSLRARVLKQRALSHPTCGVRLPMGTVQVCLTNSQFASLFGKRRTKPKQLGCGYYACVYAASDANKVVKITSDPSDIKSLIKAQGAQGAPILYHARALGENPYKTHARKRTYAAVIEKLTPMRATKTGRNFMGPWSCLRETATPDWLARYVGTPTLTATVNQCCGLGEQRKACQRALHEIANVKHEFAERGIFLWDDHTGNIGYDSKGRWKILDLGMTSNDAAGATKIRPLGGR